MNMTDQVRTESATTPRYAPLDLNSLYQEEVDSILAGLSVRKRNVLQTVIANDAFLNRMHATAEVERRLDSFTPSDLLEHLPHGPETVKALLDWMSLADWEAIHHAFEMRAAAIEAINRIFAGRPPRPSPEF